MYSVAQIPESYTITVGSGWAHRRHPTVAGEYQLDGFYKKCAGGAFLIYKHTGHKYYPEIYLLNVTNSWIVVERIFGKNLWNGDILLKRPIDGKKSLVVPEDGWYFSFDAAGGKKFIQDSDIKVYHYNPPTASAIILYCILACFGFLMLAAFVIFKMGMFPGLKKSLLERLERMRKFLYLE